MPSTSQAAQSREPFGHLPLSFERNQGQAEPTIEFLARNAGGALYLTACEALFTWQGRDADSQTTRLRLKLRNANPAPRLAGEDELPGKSHYLLGRDPSQWQRNITNYAKVRYGDVYPGIDLIFYGSGERLEYDFVVAPEADPCAIRLQFEGARNIEIAANGDLLLQTDAGVMRQLKPVIYQEERGQRRIIDGEYKRTGEGEVAVELGPYQTDKALVIDPVLSFAAQGIGGTVIAVDAAGNSYVAGATTGGLPLVNPLQEKDQKLSIRGDAYVAKLNAAGTALLYSTYIGGNASDIARGVAVDAAGHVTLVGETTSTDFTGTEFSPFFKSNDAGASWSNRNTGLDKKLELYSLLVDPANSQTLYGINGNLNLDIRVGRVVKSTDGGNTWTALENGLTAGASVLVLDARRPQTLYAGTLGGVFKTTDGGNHWDQVWRNNGVVRNLVVNPGDTNVLYACLRLGGDIGVNEAGVYRSTDGGANWQLTLRSENPDSVTVDPANPATVYVADSSALNTLYKSTNRGANWVLLNGQLNFSINSGALLVDPANSQRLYAGGGGGLRKSQDGGLTWRSLGPETNIFALALDRATPPVLYLGAGALGFTTAFPGGLFRSTDGGATWLPTSVTNIPRSLALDPNNNANVYAGVGERGNPDAFVLKLNAAGSQIVYSRLLGGSYAERATSVAVSAAGAAYVAGYTNSADFPVTSHAFQPNFKGDSVRSVGDYFLVKLNAAGATEYATYFGGSGEELQGPQLALGTAERVYLTGATTSTDLPLKLPLQASYGGGTSDAFVAKFDLAKSDADSLVYSTYLGGTKDEAGLAIGVDAQEQSCVLLAGTSSDLPVTSDTFQTGQAKLGYLAKLRADGAGFVYATYLGVAAAGLAVDRAGNAAVTGFGAGLNLPITPGALPPESGNSFALKLNADASALYFATPLDGLLAFNVAVDAVSDMYVTGYTDAAIATTPGAFRNLNFTWFTTKLSTQAHSTAVSNVSAASFASEALARNSIATIFGLSLSDETLAAAGALSAKLADVEVVVKDKRGVERHALLFYVAPGQINYLVPAELSNGRATVSVFFNGRRANSSSTVQSRVRLAQGVIQIEPMAPGIFTANADGRGVAAAVIQRVRADGTRNYEAVAQFDSVQGRFVARPIEFGLANEQLYLVLFGTGFRELSAQAIVNVSIGGVAVPVLFAGGQPTLTGLDQLNLQLPRLLAGRGDVEIRVTFDGKAANPVRVNFK